MKTSSFATAFLAASVAVALPATVAAYTMPQNVIKNAGAFPACHTRNGLPVRYIYKEYNSGSLASADTWVNPKTGKTEGYIVYEPYFAELSHARQKLVAYHECAHLKLGHVGVGRAVWSDRVKRSMELDADCHAARNMKREGVKRKIFKEAVSLLLQFPEDKEHPPGAKRYAHALQCYDVAPANGR